MIRKRVAWLLVTLVFFTLTAGAYAKTTLYVQDWWGAEPTPNMQKYYDWLKSEFESENPDVTVEYVFVPWGEYLDKLLTAAAGGAVADVAHLSLAWGHDLFAQGMILDLGDRVTKSTIYDPRDFIPASQVTNTVNGKIFGLSYSMDAGALYYNKDQFSEAGLNEDELGLETWDDFLAAAKKLTKTSGDKITRSGYFTWFGFDLLMHWIYSNDGSIFDETFTKSAMDTPQAIETIQWIQDLYNTYNVMSKDATDFPNGAVGMWGGGTWEGGTFEQINPGLRFGMTSYPVGPSGTKRGTATGTSMWSVPTSSKHPDLAFKWAEFVTGLQANLKMLTIMGRVSSPRLAFYNSVEWGNMVSQHSWMASYPAVASAGGPFLYIGFGQFMDQVGPIYRQIKDGSKPAAEIAANLTQLADKAIAETLNR